MTICRHPYTPHSFCPLIAEYHGLIAAVAEYAMRELGSACDPATFEVEDIMEKCPYLTEAEIKEAVTILSQCGLCEVIE